MTTHAVIADDEPAFASDLAERLRQLWPELVIDAIVHDGRAALQVIKTRAPDVAFLDIRMPGLSGMTVARHLPSNCRVVFVTAYDQYAVDAFETAAVDYLLKPVTRARLADSVARLRAGNAVTASAADVSALLQRLDAIESGRHRYLQWIRASVGERTQLIAVDEVRYFAADAKYTAVVTAGCEYLIRKPIKELAAELDPDRFWRIHRSTIVNVASVAPVSRGFAGRCIVSLKHGGETLTVSRSYADRFRQM